MLFDSSTLAASAVPYVFVVLGVVASFFLFASVKRDLEDQNRKQRQSIEQIMARLDEAARHWDVVGHQVIYLPTVRSSFNIHRRAQAMRLLRRGEDVSHVAAALNVPRKEVELLIRVQKLPIPRKRKG